MQRTFAKLKGQHQNQEGQCKAEKEGAEPVGEEHGHLSIKECCTDSEDGMRQYSEENKEKMIGNLKAFELQKES